MGVNIYAYRINGNKQVRIENWDSMRHSGDSELMVSEFEWIYKDNDEYEFICKPYNFNEAIEWVKSNICEENQQRLIELFELMKTDESIWIEFSI